MNEKNFNQYIPKVESEKSREIIGKLTMTRHSKTEYTEKYPDITEEGEKIAREKARLIALRNKDNSDDEERFYFSSPRPRAQSTANIIKNEMGDEDTELKNSDQIRAMDMPDMEQARKLFNELRESSEDSSIVEKSYSKDDRFENNPDSLEPRSKVNTRAMRALEYLVRSFVKNQKDKLPHVFATGHFEMLNPIIDEIFETGDETFQHVEDVEIEFLSSEDIEKKIRMKVKFRGEEKEVIFDRKTRKIIKK